MSELVGVLLAAGLGTRFEDGNKLLAPVCQRDEPIVVRAARSFPDAVDHVVAVVGHEADAVREAVSSVVDETVHNPAYERGQSTSVRTGAIAARERDADAAVFLPGDMPTVDPRTVQRIVEASREDDVDAVVPVYDGRRGIRCCSTPAVSTIWLISPEIPAGEPCSRPSRFDDFPSRIQESTSTSIPSTTSRRSSASNVLQSRTSSFSPGSKILDLSVQFRFWKTTAQFSAQFNDTTTEEVDSRQLTGDKSE